MKFFVAGTSKTSVPIRGVESREWKRWLGRASAPVRNWLTSTGFEPEAGKVALVPGPGGTLALVILGLGEATSLWSYGALPGALPRGRYHLADTLDAESATLAALGFGLGSYSYTRYKTKPERARAVLEWPEACDRREVTRILTGMTLGRDLVNRPAADLGPAEVASEVRALATRHSARVRIISGKELTGGFPAIHAVGKGAAKNRQARLCDLTWGKKSDPRITLVGKGVVFDSGGLDLKSASGMRLMKKDMGGAASVLATASMIMDARLPVRLRVLVPTVENAVSAEAFRPGDVLDTRRGITVEVGNTDAEGRLILCDALALAADEKPELIIDFATLTGAARLALGTELPAMFCTDPRNADAVREVIATHSNDPDPVWHMPLFEGYRRHLRSYIADISNVSDSSYGGAITAALFLREFVGKVPWMHIDTMAWNLSAQPGRPEGGEILGARTIYRFVRARYGRVARKR